MSSGNSHLKASELFRERIVSRYTSATLNLPTFNPNVDLTESKNFFGNHTPKPSEDATLNAFVQLGALRLNASHCMISLLDSSHQYVLAEAARAPPTDSDHRSAAVNTIWMGSVIVPRDFGICEIVLDTPDTISAHAGTSANDDAIVVIKDLKEDVRHNTRRYVTGGPQMRFYAAVPLRSAEGMTIGAYCIMDDKPRSGVSSEEKLFMSSMANTVFQHLEALRIKTEFQRRDKLVSGLESFVGGLSTLSGPQDEPVMATRNDPAQDVGPPGPDSHGYFPMVEDADDANSPSPAAMWELALPTGCKSMFSRAATILRQASDYDGVTFFYIPASGNAIPSSRSHIQPSSVAHGVPTPPSTFGVATPTGLPESLAQSDSTSADENTWSDGNSSNEPCPYLGSSAGPAGKPEHEDHPTHNYNFSERDLQRVMGSRPRAEVFLLDRTGKIMPGDTSSSGSGTEIPPAFPESTSVSQGPGSRKKKTRASRVKALRKIHPKARSFVCLPLWDYTRQRWFAFVVCWIVKPIRDPVVDGDLNFLKIFGNSITNTLSHLDALDVDRAKTSFVSSISHELRSPLHGVLGATNFLNDSGLSPFQSEMVDSITTCGRTLLQTLEHVMDFTKINDFSKNPSKHAMANIKGRKHDRSQTLKTLPESSLMSSVNMSVLVEEVVESTMMGFTVQHDFLHAEDGGTPKITGNLKKVANARRSLYRRGRTRVILKVPSNKQWYFDTQAGAWRRIIMNLVGNALKYTAKGLIEVSLEARDLEQQPGDTENNEDCATLVLTVKDTGIGMSPYFMQNQLYKPFSQENSFAPGTGLGLSIVRQVVDSLGGQVNVSSKKGTGTTITVAIECKRSEKQEPEHEKPTSVSSVARRMQGLHVCVLEDVKSRGSKDNSSAFLQAEETFSASLLTTLRAWFGMNMTVQASVPRDADLVICLEPSFRQLEAIRLQFPDRSAPPTLFIAHDVLEMAVLRADARVVSQESIVEITYQPLGPKKLAKALFQCLDGERLGVSNEDTKYGLAESIVPPAPPVPARNPSRKTPSWRTASPEPAQTRSETPDNSSDWRILCVDDNPLNLRLLTTFTTRHNLGHEEATNGKQAVELYQAAPRSYRCVLMDISMPVMDGMTATRKIREFECKHSLPRTPIYALTGLASATARNEALEAGVDQFLTKPISFPQLAQIVFQTSPPTTPFSP